MGALERRNDALGPREQVERRQRLLVGARQVLGAARIAKRGVLRPDARVVEARRDRVRVGDLAVLVGQDRRARAVEDRFAFYEDAWRVKVERIGTLNFPAEARGKLYGSLRLTVTLRPDGSVESIELDRSSGLKVLDAAAFRIVNMATPFAWPAIWYILVGVGFALMVPAGSTAAMAEVPVGSSGIGSGLFNACRQVGTATGLAILGSIGASVTLAQWHRHAASFPPGARRRAGLVGSDVAGGQVHAAATHVSGHSLNLAVDSFLHGFELALLLAGAIVAVGGIVGFQGLRHLQLPASPVRQRSDRAIRDGVVRDR